MSQKLNLGGISEWEKNEGTPSPSGGGYCICCELNEDGIYFEKVSKTMQVPQFGTKEHPI